MRDKRPTALRNNFRQEIVRRTSNLRLRISFFTSGFSGSSALGGIWPSHYLVPGGEILSELPYLLVISNAAAKVKDIAANINRRPGGGSLVSALRRSRNRLLVFTALRIAQQGGIIRSSS